MLFCDSFYGGGGGRAVGEANVFLCKKVYRKINFQAHTYWLSFSLY